MKGVELEKSENVDGEDCYVISGNLIGRQQMTYLDIQEDTPRHDGSHDLPGIYDE